MIKYKGYWIERDTRYRKGFNRYVISKWKKGKYTHYSWGHISIASAKKYINNLKKPIKIRRHMRRV